MRDDERLDGSGAEAPAPTESASGARETDHTADPSEHDEPFDESLTEELSALIDDGRTYAEAELAFQKTRAALAGRKIGGALAFGLLAIILLHLALIALAVGVVIALEPIVTIWGAIGIVVGVLLLGVVLLVLAARANALRLAELFKGDDA